MILTGSELTLPKVPTTNWSDDELAASVEAYIYLLRLQTASLPVPKGAERDLLRTGSLNTRNEASVRYRLRNISAVVEELGGPVLLAYSPASQVGRNVRERLRSMLLAHPGFLQLRKSAGEHTENSGVPTGDPRSEALARLAALRLHVGDLEREIIGVGHNNPPETLTPGGPARRDFDLAREDIDALEEEVRKIEPNPSRVRSFSLTC